jgi:hypothetical protein
MAVVIRKPVSGSIRIKVGIAAESADLVARAPVGSVSRARFLRGGNSSQRWRAWNDALGWHLNGRASTRWTSWQV